MLLSVKELRNRVNWEMLSSDESALIEDGLLLLSSVEAKSLDHISDYSFVVAPFAKAYEGFLKSFLLKQGIISESECYSDHFRLGKVLNPHLKHRNFSVYSRLENLGEKGATLASVLWEAWREGRNLIFHYFPGNLRKIDFAEAKEKICLIFQAINTASFLLDKERPVVDNVPS